MEMPLTLIPLQIFALLYAIVIHEWSHGYAAYKMGDYTAYHAGRLSLNPIHHIDLFGTIILPGFLLISGSPFVFGYAKPVPVNPYNFKDYKKGEIIVSLAGPGSNLISVFVFTILYMLITKNPYEPSSSNYIAILLFFMILINLVLVAFNLLPIPPLAGSHVLQMILPEKYASKISQLGPYGFFIVILLLFLGVIRIYLGFILFIYTMVTGLPINYIMYNILNSFG